MKPKITVLMATARDDYTLSGMPKTHIFDLPLETLRRQTFRDFEFIIVDSLYEKRKNYFQKIEAPFSIKHIPPKSSPWIDKGLCHIANDWNTAIIHAEGELLVRMDDWTKPATFSTEIYEENNVLFSDFDTEYLSKIWSWYKNKRWAVSLSLYYQGVPAENVPSLYLKHYTKLFGDKPNGETLDRKLKVLDIIYQKTKIMDYRYSMLKGTQATNIEPGAFAGLSAVPLEPLLDVNGIDELFDGCKTLEDTDLGYRLDFAGYHNKFVMDEKLVVIEYQTTGITPHTLYSAAFKSNVGLALMNFNWKRWRANTELLTKEQIDYVRKETVERVGQFTKERQKLFDFWLHHQPNFNLKEMRKKLDVER